MNEALKLKKATYHLYTFTISKLISSFGTQIYAFAISFYILQMTGSATSFALNLVCNILPRTIAAPFAGFFVDRYSKKLIIIVSQIATTLTIAGLLVITIMSGLSLVAIYVTTCILSLTSMFSGVTFTSSITGLVDKGRIQRAMSLNQMAISFAAIGSPAVGGLLYGAVSMELFLMIYIAASIMAVILESTMNFTLFSKAQDAVNPSKETMWDSMKAGVRYLRLQPILVTIVWISFLVNFLFGAFEVGYSFILIETLKMEPSHFGSTQGAFAVGMLLMSIFYSVRKEVNFPLIVSKRGIIALGVIMASVSLPLMHSMSYGSITSYYLVVMLINGMVIIVVNTPLQVMLQKQIDDDYKGRVFSIIETCAMALMPLGMILYGFLYDVFPAQWVLILSAMLLIGVVLILARPSIIRNVYPMLAKEEKVIRAGEKVI